ncbi:MAG: hypothetical protein JXB34_10150 [Bacteroidales bacterium]|nr:hypothetical protein [Bacteroidales bacterium]
MKQIFSIVTFVVIFFIPAKAQQSCGIYRNFDDFRQNKISIPANPKFEKKAVQVSDFFLRPYVYIKTDSNKLKISIDSVYAIRCSNGNVYRICNNRAYQLVDTGFVKIYTYTCMESVKHLYSRGYRHTTEQVTHYYFSKNYLTPITLLTLTNVRLSLHLDENTDNKLIQNFPNDKSLLENKNNHFFINDFFNELKQ